MGATHYVTVTAREYAALQRIVGVANATMRAIPAVYNRETALLREAVAEYESRYVRV